MRRRRLAIVLVLVALAGGALVWWKTRGGAGPTAAPAGPDPWAHEDTEALVAQKRASRGNTPVDERPAVLGGTVVRASDGMGVAGAVVTVNARELGSAFFPSDAGEDVVVVTDATGAWRAPRVRPGPQVVSAASPELLPASVDVELGPGASRTDLVLRLEAGGASLSGLVEDIGGGAIPDARVTVRAAGLDAIHSSRRYVATTGADGRYRLMLPDGAWQVTAAHAAYTEDERAVVLRGQPITADFRLTPGGTIYGQVIARDTGQPVPAAQVHAGGGHGGGDAIAIRGGGRTDAGGQFVLRGVRSGAIAVRATASGYASREPTVVDLGIGEEVTGVRVLVERAYTVSGFVVRQGRAGEGIPGVRVAIFSLGAEQASTALAPSAADGYFEIVGVQPGNYLVAALGEGVMPEIGQPVAVVDADLDGVLVQMNPGATLEGRVEPGAIARLSLQLDPSKIGLGNMFDLAKAALVHATSDATGAFTLRSVPDGTFAIHAQAPDGRTGTLPVTIAGGADQRGLVVPVEPRGAISGRVVDARGTAVAGVTVEARPSGGGGFTLDLGDGLNQSVTALDGSFRVAGLPPGTVTLSVRDEQGPLAWAEGRPWRGAFEIAGAEEQRDVVLEVEARDGVIRGVVLGVDRRPVADAWVTARATTSPWSAQMRRMRDPDGKRDEEELDLEDEERDEAGQGRGAGTTVLTGDDGRFTITGLRRGGYHVSAEATKGGVRGEQHDVQTGAAITIVLAPLGALTVAVTAGGAPAPAYDLTCDGPSDDTRRRVTAPDGVTVIERRAPGRYRCTATTDAGAAVGTVQLAGAGARLGLAIAGWATVAGTVVDDAGQPRAGLRVIAFGAAGSASDAMTQMIAGGGVRTDGAGRFELGKLTAGAATVMIFESTGFSPLLSEEVTLTAGERKDLGTLTATPSATPGRDAGSGG